MTIDKGNLSRHRKLRGAAGRCLRGSGKSKGGRRGAEPAGRVPLYNGQGRQIGWKEVYGKHNMERYHSLTPGATPQQQQVPQFPLAYLSMTPVVQPNGLGKPQ